MRNILGLSKGTLKSRFIYGSNSKKRIKKYYDDKINKNN